MVVASLAEDSRIIHSEKERRCKKQPYTLCVRQALSDLPVYLGGSCVWFTTHSVYRWVYNGVFFGVNNGTALSKARWWPECLLLLTAIAAAKSQPGQVLDPLPVEMFMW